MNARESTASEFKMINMVLINRRQLLKMIPLSDRTIYDMEKRGEFPRRFSITPRLVAWDLREVEAWIESKKSNATLAIEDETDESKPVNG